MIVPVIVALALPLACCIVLTIMLAFDPCDGDYE
jgi:hypothetical protein